LAFVLALTKTKRRRLLVQGQTSISNWC